MFVLSRVRALFLLKFANTCAFDTPIPKNRSAPAKKNIAQGAGDGWDVVQGRGQRQELERRRQLQTKAQRLIPGDLDELTSTLTSAR